MHTKRWFSTCAAKLDAWEQLESRVCLAGDTVGGDETPCLLEVAAEEATARAVHAVNCFAIDLYNNLQQETGNVFFSPLSVSTAFAMTYAGAAGRDRSADRPVSCTTARNPEFMNRLRRSSGRCLIRH